MADGGRWLFLDLDGFGWSDPARDVGNLLAYLRWKALREPRHTRVVAEGRHAFLTGYTARRGALSERHLAAYEAVSMLRIAGRRYRNLAMTEWPLVPRLVDAALEACASARAA
jgi:aminoglycoside phosphotransferase (APT) family kinase protein